MESDFHESLSRHAEEWIEDNGDTSRSFHFNSYVGEKYVLRLSKVVEKVFGKNHSRGCEGEKTINKRIIQASRR